MIAVRATVTGVVHGVGFRWHARGEAQRLGITGWVRNRADGTVEAHLEGPESSVDEMLAWLGEGPAPARVDDVEVTEAESEGSTDFTIRRE